MVTQEKLSLTEAAACSYVCVESPIIHLPYHIDTVSAIGNYIYLITSCLALVNLHYFHCGTWRPPFVLAVERKGHANVAEMLCRKAT